MKRPVQGDQTQHISVAQRWTSKRHIDLVTRWDPLLCGLLRNSHGHPCIAAQTPTPALGIDFADNDCVPRRDHCGVLAHKRVAVPCASEQFVPVVGALRS